MDDRTATTMTLVAKAGAWEISFGNEVLIIPIREAEAMARHILGQVPATDVTKAALAVSSAKGG